MKYYINPYKRELEPYSQLEKSLAYNLYGSMDGVMNIIIRGSCIIQNDKLPNFKYINGFIQCSAIKLTSLKGSPIYVGGDFDCDINDLTTLQYAPLYVGGDFTCNKNDLIDLKYSPKYVGRNFSCYDNRISLKRPRNIKIIGRFYNE
jgi:hypothetical protein